jgi:uncharacterized protein
MRILIATLFAGVVTLSAQSLPTLTGPVNDFAHVIDAASAQELDKRIRSLETTTHDAVVVATVDTFQPYGTIEEYAVKLFEKSGIGQKGKDNGLLVVVAVKDRRVKIEVGYGLEEFITDGFSGDTIRQAILPAFREGRYGPGILAGTTRIIQRIAEKRGVTLTDVPAAPAQARSRGFSIENILPLLPIGFIILMIILRSSGGGPRGFGGGRRSGGWSGWHGGVGGFGGFGGLGGGFGRGGGGGFGGGGGGFGGFGGGRSGGGGASGGW